MQSDEEANWQPTPQVHTGRWHALMSLHVNHSIEVVLLQAPVLKKNVKRETLKKISESPCSHS